jgi:hypothetical protein
MRPEDPFRFDPRRLERQSFVGEVVLTTEMTPLLREAAARGCRYQIGTDMLFEQIPAYLELFGYGETTPEELRATARISYLTRFGEALERQRLTAAVPRRPRSAVGKPVEAGGERSFAT